MRLHTALSVAIVAAGLASGCAREEVRDEPRSEITARDIGEALVTDTRHFSAVGMNPVYQVLPGRAAFADRVERDKREKGERSLATTGDLERSLDSDEVARVEGEIKIEAIDRVDQDEARQVDGTGQGDEAAVAGWFKDSEGTRYDFVLDRISPLETSFDGFEATRFGGVGTDLPLFGETGLGQPTTPKVRASVAVFGIGTLRRAGALVGEYPMQVFVTSRTRSPETGLFLGDYDLSSRPPEEVHLVIQRTIEPIEAKRTRSEDVTVPAGAPRSEVERPAVEELPKPAAVGIPLPQGFHVIWGNSSLRYRPF